MISNKWRVPKKRMMMMILGSFKNRQCKSLHNPILPKLKNNRITKNRRRWLRISLVIYQITSSLDTLISLFNKHPDLWINPY